MTKVAVVTRTKDRPLFLARAIESVAAQTYSDYMHVIVNDGGSKADIERMLESLDEGTRKKIKLFHREQPSNAPDTIFNESIDRIDSTYFVIHDDDDSWHEDFLKTTVRHMDHDQSLGGVVVRADKIIERVTNNKIKRIKVIPWMPDIRVINLYRQHIDNQLTPIATLFRRSAYEKVGKFDSSLPVVGDWEFGIRLLCSYDVDFIDPGYALANYHHRKYAKDVQGNQSFAGNDLHRYYSNLVMNRYLRKELDEGRLGSGYIMSKIRYDQHNLSSMVKKILPSSIVNKIKQRVEN